MGPTNNRSTSRLVSTWIRSGAFTIHAKRSTVPMTDAAPTIVMVHGVGVSHRYLMPTAELLATFCRVWVPDLPGFGLSSKPRHILTLQELSDALADWMGTANIPSASLLGNSFGCQIIADFAVRHSSLIERAILQGPTVDPAGRTARQQLWRWLVNGRHEAPAQALVILRDYRDCGLQRVFRTFKYALDDHIEGTLPHVRVPTLVVRGSRDVIVPQRWAEEVTRLLPDGRLVIIPDAAHTLNYQKPAELTEAVRSFLSDTATRHAA
jgi:pimeloyl-ACP methyl ester carboxylesterase